MLVTVWARPLWCHVAHVVVPSGLNSVKTKWTIVFTLPPKFKEKISSASTRSGSTGGAGACAAGSYPRGVLGGH